MGTTRNSLKLEAFQGIDNVHVVMSFKTASDRSSADAMETLSNCKRDKLSVKDTLKVGFLIIILTLQKCFMHFLNQECIHCRLSQP